MLLKVRTLLIMHYMPEKPAPNYKTSNNADNVYKFDRILG